MQRRYFLYGTLAAPLAQKIGAQNTPETIGAGYIGVGNRGGSTMRATLQVPGVKMAAICDLKPDRLDKAATLAARDNPKTYTDYRKLLEDKNVQAVHISTPCDLHVEMAIAALKAGKHVYVEKPVGIEPKSIGELVRVVKSSKLVLTVGQQLRSTARYKALIPQIQEGVCGKVVMIKAQRHASDDLAHDGSSAEWFFDAKRSGDVIVEMSVHNLDLCNWVANSHPERAAGFGGTMVWVNDPPGRTNMDGYSLTYDYANGVKLSYTQVFFHPRGMPNNGQWCMVFGTKGGVDLDTGTFYPRERNAQPQKLFEATAQDRLDPSHIGAFYDAIRKGTPNPADITVGATGALTAIMGREAIYQKRVTTWKEMGVTL
jgi:myo-inositol 2-dehydrogenase/D-chiro-inositol 1-dehydrogenase